MSNDYGRMDIVAIRQYTKKDGTAGTSFIKCGSAWPRKSKPGEYMLNIEMLPPAHDGAYRFMLSTPNEQESSGGGGTRGPARQAEEEIPF